MTIILKFVKDTKRYWQYEPEPSSGCVGKLYIPKREGLTPMTITVEVPA